MMKMFVLHPDEFTKGFIGDRCGFAKGRNTLERIGWLPFSLKYSIDLDRISVYSAAFFGSEIATCIASPMVKWTLVLSLDSSLTCLGKI
jgi:hypothetical protein